MEELMQSNPAKFDPEIFDKITKAKGDLLIKTNIEEALSILSSIPVNHHILEITGIESTIRNTASALHPTVQPICDYILRKWNRQKRNPERIKPRLLMSPSRHEKELKIKFDPSEHIFKTLKQRKMIHWNKKRGVASLKDLCRREIQSRICVAVKRKRVVILYSLISNMTKEQLERIEEKITAVTEISELLWEAMLYYHFRGQCVPLLMTNKEAFNYLWTRREEFNDELPVPRALPVAIPLKSSLVVRKLFNRLFMYLAEIFV